MSNEEPRKFTRGVGRWYIGETLGKGGYSWVKKGYDKKTGKKVALKFMAKADVSWLEEQQKQVITEIESLKQIRNDHVMKLYAYNLSSKYPTKENKFVDTILLVLEYAPGGELFDILYYTSYLEEIVARTYFLQMIDGLDACHKAGVIHRDLKPQNLLLDSKFNLKITDFGLSKVFAKNTPENEKVMSTTYVGTRGYQAPELLLDQEFGAGCDIFSAGVVLFILMTGYPPFEQATKKDKWYGPLATGNLEKFWKRHLKSQLAQTDDCRDLIEKMLEYDPAKRLTMDQVKEHPWSKGKTLSQEDLIRTLRQRHRKMEAKRAQDARKQSDLGDSLKKQRDLDFKGIEEPPMFPEDDTEGIHECYTMKPWKEVFNIFDAVLGEVGAVVTSTFTQNECLLDVSVNWQLTATSPSTLVKFDVKIWRSREFSNPPAGNEKDVVYVIRMTRNEGDIVAAKMAAQTLILTKCAPAMTGLPVWAETADIKEVTLSSDNNDEDDYANQLGDNPFAEVSA